MDNISAELCPANWLRLVQLSWMLTVECGNDLKDHGY